jgi:hypothetical protein
MICAICHMHRTPRNNNVDQSRIHTCYVNRYPHFTPYARHNLHLNRCSHKEPPPSYDTVIPSDIENGTPDVIVSGCENAKQNWV